MKDKEKDEGDLFDAVLEPGGDRRSTNSDSSTPAKRQRITIHGAFHHSAITKV